MNLQKIILDRLTVKAGKRGYVVANNADYGNTGWVLFMDQDLTTKFSLSYSFHPKYYMLTLYEGKPIGNVHKEALYENNTRKDEAGEVITAIMGFLERV